MGGAGQSCCPFGNSRGSSAACSPPQTSASTRRVSPGPSGAARSRARRRRRSARPRRAEQSGGRAPTDRVRARAPLRGPAAAR
eukprot:2620038-Prymnesium_polylepis.2